MSASSDLETIPEWVPRVVSDWARRLWTTDDLTPKARDALRRLVSDDRMKNVWRELKESHDLKESHFEKRVAPEEENLVAYFYEAVIKADIKTWTKKEITAERNRLLELSKHAKALHAGIRGRRDNIYVRNMWRLYCHNRRSHLPRDVELHEMATLINHLGQFLQKLPQKQYPQGTAPIVGQQRANNRARVYYLNLARVSHHLFGSPLYGTTATMTNVALGLSGANSITSGDVEAAWKREQKRQR